MVKLLTSQPFKRIFDFDIDNKRECAGVEKKVFTSAKKKVVSSREWIFLPKFWSRNVTKQPEPELSSSNRKWIFG